MAAGDLELALLSNRPDGLVGSYLLSEERIVRVLRAHYAPSKG